MHSVTLTTSVGAQERNAGGRKKDITGCGFEPRTINASPRIARLTTRVGAPCTRPIMQIIDLYYGVGIVNLHVSTTIVYLYALSLLDHYLKLYTTLWNIWTYQQLCKKITQVVYNLTQIVYNFTQVVYFFYTTVGRFICFTVLCKLFKQWSNSVYIVTGKRKCYTAKTTVLNSTPPVLWEVHTKLVLILTPVSVSLIPLGVKFNTGGC